MSVGARSIPSSICKTRWPWPPVRRTWPPRPEKVAAAPDRYELHQEDETHVETNPYLTRVWHRRGQQPTVPAAGTNRRLTVFGSVEVFGRGRVEVVCAGQDSAGFERFLEALEARHAATGKEMFLVLDNGSCHTSAASRAALAARAGWLHVIWLAKYSPELNRKEREWRALKRDARGHLAASLSAFVDELLDGLGQLGGERLDIRNDVPAWFLAGHRKAPTGRPPGRPLGAKDSYKRAPYPRRRPTIFPAAA
jgi:acylphosphatase